MISSSSEPADSSGGSELHDAFGRLRVVLVRTSHPGNIGAAARAMHTMGLSRLYLVEPKRFPDPEAQARATGASGLLDAAVVTPTLDLALADCAFVVGFSARSRQLASRVVTARNAVATAVSHAADVETALVFGNEMSGLSNDELARCTIVATIPANPGYSSLNLAAAVQIAAYEARLAALGNTEMRIRQFAPATRADIESLYAHAKRTMAELGFYDPQRPRRLLARLRRLFARTGLEREEVNILRGLLAAIDRALNRDDAK